MRDGDVLLSAYEALGRLKDLHLDVVVAVVAVAAGVVGVVGVVGVGGVWLSAVPEEPRHRTPHPCGQNGAGCTY